MKGLITKTAALACLGSGLLALAGCGTYRDLVDPCYPERYAFQARQSVQSTLAAQVNNGHVLDQTVWNHYFEAGTDKLTPGGQTHLAYLARRRPQPDTKIYLQTAQDVAYDAEKVEKFVNDRAELDSKRTQAVQKYLNAQTAGRPVTFEVAVHDPSGVGLPAVGVNQAVLKHYGNYQGMMSPSGSSGGTAGGASGGSSGGGR